MFKKFNPCNLRKPIAIKNNKVFSPFSKSIVPIPNDQKVLNNTNNEIKEDVELIIASIHLNKYHFANEKIKKFFSEYLQNNQINIATNDIITSIFNGIIYVKNAKVNKYMTLLQKLNSFSKKETILLALDKNCKQFSIKIFLNILQNTPLFSLFQPSSSTIKVNLPKKNKSCDCIENPKINFNWNYHNFFELYLLYGYFTLSNKIPKNVLSLNEKLEALNILEKHILKEKCNNYNCEVCKKINDILIIQPTLPTQSNNCTKSSISGYEDSANNQSKSEDTKKSINIRINNNCTSAKKLLKDCHFAKKEKNRNTFLCSFQHYMSNTLNSHGFKKNSSNYDNSKTKLNASNNNTYTCADVKTTTANSKTTYNNINNSCTNNSKISQSSLNCFSLKKSPVPDSFKKLEKSMSIIEANIESIQHNFNEFERFNNKIKLEMISILKKKNYKNDN